MCGTRSVGAESFTRPRSAPKAAAAWPDELHPTMGHATRTGDPSSPGSGSALRALSSPVESRMKRATTGVLIGGGVAATLDIVYAFVMSAQAGISPTRVLFVAAALYLAASR